MIKIQMNGKPFTPETFEEQLILVAADAVREKLGAIRHPTTGEFPTIAVTGTSLESLKIQLEGSPELIALAQRRLAGEDDECVEVDSFNNDVSVRTEIGPPRVFLSFAFEDEKLAERIATALNEQGIDTWWAGWCIAAGDSIRQKIDEGLSGCTHFIVLLTPRSVAKPWVLQEMDAGLVRKLSSGTKFIVLRSDLSPASLPPLLQGSLSPAVDPNAFDITQLINDIHGISRKPPVGLAPNVVQQAKVTSTGYSAAATSLAKYFVENTDFARKFEPRMTIADVALATELSHEDVVDAAHELMGLVSVYGENVLYPEEELFVRFDKFWKRWDPAIDALTLATRMVNNPGFPEQPKAIAEALQWEPRRLNPALAFLCQRKLAWEFRALNTGPWLVSAIRKTDATRRFVKSRQ
jgi:hypothetical protein